MAYLDGKTIAVTGAGRGIGRAVALACAAAGANVVVNDYGVSIDGADPDSEIANAVVAEIGATGGQGTAVADSVTTMAGGARIVQTAADTYGRIDGVVCVAGILREFANGLRRVPIQAQPTLITEGRMLLGTDIRAICATLGALDVQVVDVDRGRDRHLVCPKRRFVIKARPYMLGE